MFVCLIDQVMLRTRPKLHATLVMVKGQQWEVQGTMEATTLLINYMCGNLAVSHPTYIILFYSSISLFRDTLL